jgi:hypothetical protein
MAKQCIEVCPLIANARAAASFWLNMGTIDNVVPPSVLIGGLGRNLRAADRLQRAIFPTMGLFGEGTEVPAYDPEAIENILDLCDRSYKCKGPQQGKVRQKAEFARLRGVFNRETTRLVDGIVCPIADGEKK